MADTGAERTSYPKGKVESSGTMKDAIRGGGSGDGGGVTGSSRSYPKSDSFKMNSGLNPMDDKQRGGTDWVVGGV